MSGNYRIKSLQIFRAKHVSLPFQGVNSTIQETDPFSLGTGVGAQLCQGSCCGKRPGQLWLLPLGSRAEPALQLLVPLSHLGQGRGEPGSREGGKSCEEQPWELPSQRMRQGRRCWSRSWFHLSAVRRGCEQPTHHRCNVTT